MTAAMDAGQVAGLVALGWVAASLAAGVMWVLLASSVKAISRYDQRRLLERHGVVRRRETR